MTDTPDRSTRIAWLVRRARKGQDEAFAELLELHAQTIASTLYACGVRDPEAALDLTQEVALKAWTGLGTLRDPSVFGAWIRRLAANATRDLQRRQAARPEEALELAPEPVSHDDPERVAARDLDMRLAQRALSGEDAQIVDLLESQARGATIAELAERAGLSEAATKMKLMRGRKRLRRRLAELRAEAWSS